MNTLAKALAWLIWLADEALDRLPAYESGRWYRYGQWGCRLGLRRLWGRFLEW